MEYIHNLIWLCPFLFIAGFIDSIAGGGGLIALPAYMDVRNANLLRLRLQQSSSAPSEAPWRHGNTFKNGCLWTFKITLISAVTSFLCSMLGTRIIFYLKEEQIRFDVNGTASTHRGPRNLYEERLELYRYEKPLILPNVLHALSSE